MKIVNPDERNFVFIRINALNKPFIDENNGRTLRIFNENYFCKSRPFDCKLPAQLNNSHYAFNPPMRHDMDTQALPFTPHGTPATRPIRRRNATPRALTTLAISDAHHRTTLG